MGTSSSHPGSKDSTPLVPPWADPDNLTPSPDPQPDRFRSFRTQLGKFVVQGDEGHLHAALGRFARKTSHGASVGARRFTSMAGAGADAVLAFREPGGLSGGLERAGVDLSTLRGASLNTVIEAIARAFAPNNADHDKVEEALRAALDVVLEKEDEFNFDAFQGFTDETYVTLVAVFIENCVFQHILVEGGAAWDHAATPSEQQIRENQLRETIRSEVGRHLQPLVDKGVTSMTRAELITAQTTIIQGVLSSWEGYDG